MANEMLSDPRELVSDLGLELVQIKRDLHAVLEDKRHMKQVTENTCSGGDHCNSGNGGIDLLRRKEW